MSGCRYLHADEQIGSRQTERRADGLHRLARGKWYADPGSPDPGHRDPPAERGRTNPKKQSLQDSLVITDSYPITSTSTTDFSSSRVAEIWSPGLIGLTPSGVPVKIRSPGCRVKCFER